MVLEAYMAVILVETGTRTERKQAEAPKMLVVLSLGLLLVTFWAHFEIHKIELRIFVLFRMSTWISSVQFSHSVVSDSLWPHESQHARPPCSSPTPGVHPNSCPSSQWCHPAISSSVVPFSSCPQSVPASVFSNESTLRMWWPKYWSFSFSIIPSKEITGSTYLVYLNNNDQKRNRRNFYFHIYG